jgi:hypothetical protein
MKKSKVPNTMQFSTPIVHHKPTQNDNRLFDSMLGVPHQPNVLNSDLFSSMANVNYTENMQSFCKKKPCTWFPPDPDQVPKAPANNLLFLQSIGNAYENKTPYNQPEIDIKKEGKGAWGDPHFNVTGSNGKRIEFDHKGVDGHQYHLFSGDNINIAGTYVPARDPKNPQIIGNASIRLGNDQIDYAKDGKILLNGNEIEKGEYQLESGGTLKAKRHSLTITPKDGTGVVDLYANRNGLRIDPSGKFRNLDGIIGMAIALNRGLSNEECEAFDMMRRF